MGNRLYIKQNNIILNIKNKLMIKFLKKLFSKQNITHIHLHGEITINLHGDGINMNNNQNDIEKINSEKKKPVFEKSIEMDPDLSNIQMPEVDFGEDVTH